MEAFSGPSGFLAYLASHAVQVAVLDIWTENMTGMDLLGHLRARSPQTRTILISGDEESHAGEAAARAAGAFAFFLKPLNATDFLDAVHRAFTAAHASVPAPERAKHGIGVPR